MNFLAKLRYSIPLYSVMLLISFQLTSCEGNDDDPEPDEDDDTIRLNSPGGIELRLEWTSGGSFSQGIDVAELDVFLVRNGTEVESSEGRDALSKRINMSQFLSSGTYEVRINEVEMQVQSVSYNLVISGDNDIYTLSGTYKASENSEGENAAVAALRIRKSGDEYTLIDDF